MGSEKDAVVQYYDDIADTYDESRFGNNYGKLIDTEERMILDKLLSPGTGEKRLEIACGTGRLTNYATHGLDASGEMLRHAAARHRHVEWRQASGDDTGYEEEAFDVVYTFHLLMHLEPEVIRGIFREAHRILKPGGRFIFDIPSKKRRRLFHHRQVSWHGGTELSRDDIVRLMGDDFSLGRSFGVMALPVHRLPNAVRRPLIRADYAVANSAIKEYSSYIVYELIKGSTENRFHHNSK